MARPVKAAAAACALALLAGACASDARTTVRLQLFGDGAEIRAYRSLIEAFERANDDVRVELIAVPSQGDHYTKLATAFSGGNPPDLFLANFRRFGQFAGKGVLEPLGPAMSSLRLREADFYDTALDAFRFGGELVCLPQNISSLVVYWNRALFRDAGVPPPSADWSWADLLDAAKRLTRAPEVYGLGTEPSLIRVAPFVWQAGGEVVDDPDRPTKTVMLDRSALRGIRFFIELRRRHGVTPTHEDAESEDLETRFESGRLGMLLESRRYTATLREVKGLDWDVAPLPRDREAATILHADAYCLARASKVKDAARRLVGFALGTEGASLIARTGRTVPSVRSVAGSPAFLDPQQRPASARVFLDVIPRIRRLPNIATWNEIESKADPIVEEWYYGQEPPEALGVEIDLATRKLFAEAG